MFIAHKMAAAKCTVALNIKTLRMIATMIQGFRMSLKMKNGDLPASLSMAKWDTSIVGEAS